MASRYLSSLFFSTGTYDWNTSTTWSATFGGTPLATGGVPTSADTVFLHSNVTGSTLTINAGTGQPVCAILSGDPASSSGIPYTLNFASGTSINIAGTTGTVFNMYNNFYMTGTLVGRFSVNLTGNTTSTRTIAYGTSPLSTFWGFGESKPLDITVSAGTGTIALTGNSPTVNNLTFSNTSGALTMPTTSLTVYGNFTTTSSGITSSAVILQFLATSGTQQIKSNGGNFSCPITFGAAGSTATKYQLQDNLSVSVSTSRAITFVAGTFDFNNYTLNHYGTVTRSGTNTLGLNFGISGVYNNQLVVSTGTNTVWSFPDLTNFSISPYSKAKFRGNDTSGVQSVLHGSTSGDESKALGYAPTNSSNYTGGRLVFNGYIGDYDFSFLSSWPSSAITPVTIYGSVILNAGGGSYSPGAVTSVITMGASLAYTPSAGLGYINGQQYQIVTIGTTDFTAIGASANTVGTVFTFNGVTSQAGTTGTAIPVRYIISNNSSSTNNYAPPITIGNGTSQSYVKLAGNSFSSFGTGAVLTILNLVSGTFDTNGQGFYATLFNYNNTNTKKITIDNSVILVQNINVTPTIGTFLGNATGTTFNCNNTNTSIQFQEAFGASTIANFHPNGGTFKDVKIITNPSNTVNYPLSLYINLGATSTTIETLSNQGQTCYFYFAAGSTTYLTNLTANITTGTFVYIRSGTAGTQATLSSTTPIISVSNYDIKDSNATGGASWRAYTDTNGNINSGNNSGWIFSSGAGGTNKFFLMF